ncbi:unnamed protein product [Plutella xylostella]|uniref:(diamondback moth) hypothetical protein n=1 Tax=Plutella xylostella TaxID=51655 RepID=A0A8S4FUB8_PLUXY|nr:unnamed protein product [Plutella xylostella]
MANILDVSTEDNLQYQFFPLSNGSVTFQVKAANDAHIALTQGPQESDPMYEIFIGGWSNAKSVIRKNRTKPDVVEIETPGILSGSEFRGFWVRWDSGIISAGREGEAIPFISWTDPEPFPVAFVGVCTGWGATGTWKIEDGAPFETEDKLEYKFGPVVAGSLEIDFRGPSNCHVCLSNVPAENDTMYEFIIGGWENTKSAIRYCRQKPDKAEVPTRDILNADEFRKLLIEWKCGRFLVRDGSSGAVIMEWTDATPFPVTHFGVRTGCPVSTSSLRHAGRLPWSGQRWWSPSLGRRSRRPGAPGAVVGGQDCSGEPLYVARAPHEGAIIPGKLVGSHGCAYIPWGGAEHGKSEYQVLVGGPNNWVPTSGSSIPPGAFPAGESEDGEPLFIGRVSHEGSMTTGKVQQSHGVCYISFAGQELGFPEYEVLTA